MLDLLHWNIYWNYRTCWFPISSYFSLSDFLLLLIYTFSWKSDQTIVGYKVRKRKTLLRRIDFHLPGCIETLHDPFLATMFSSWLTTLLHHLEYWWHQGSLLIPKIEFFIKGDIWVWVFYEYGQWSFFIKRGSFFYKQSYFSYQKGPVLTSITYWI